MDNLLPMLVKLVTGFVGLWAMTRLLGKKEISALTPFDFISAVILGDLVGETIYEDKHNWLMLVFTLAVWTGLSILFEKLTQHYKRLRQPLEGEPEILIRDGQIDLSKLRKNNLDFDQLRMMLRSKDIFSMNEVAYAIYETNGSLSVMKKPPYEAVTREDLELKERQVKLPIPLVEEGTVQRESLRRLRKDESWLRETLQERGFPDVRLIAYAEYDQEGELRIIPSAPEHVPKPPLIDE